jgi:hypothetical protein
MEHNMNKKPLYIILAALCITSQLSAQTTGTTGLSYTPIDGGKAYSVSKGKRRSTNARNLPIFKYPTM